MLGRDLPTTAYGSQPNVGLHGLYSAIAAVIYVVFFTQKVLRNALLRFLPIVYIGNLNILFCVDLYTEKNGPPIQGNL